MSAQKHIDFRSLLKFQINEVAIFTIANFISQIGSFLFFPLFWKKLSPLDYGLIAITEMIGSVLGIFMGLSLDSSISRLYYEWPEPERKRNLGAIWLISWFSSLVLGGISILILSFSTDLLFPGVSFYPYVFLGLINTILTSMTVIVLMTIRIKRLPFLYSLYSVGNFFIQLSLNIYFVLILDKKVYGYFVSNIIGETIAVVLGFVVMLFFAQPTLKNCRIKESLKFALPIIPTNFISSISGVVDKFILQRFASLETLGIYYVCLKFTSLINSAHATLKLSYVPFISQTVSEYDHRESAPLLAKMSILYLLPLTIITMAVSIYLKEVVLLVNRPAYFPVINYVPFFMVATLILTSNLYLTPGLYLAKRTDLMWIPSFLQLLAIILGGLIFIPLFRLSGVVISRYINSFIYLGVSYYFTKKFYPLPIPWVKVINVLLFSVLGIVISLSLELQGLASNILAKTLVIVLISSVCLLSIIGFSRIPELFSCLPKIFVRLKRDNKLEEEQ